MSNTKSDYNVSKLLTDKQVEDMFCTALEGGINYWANVEVKTAIRDKYRSDERPAPSEYLFDAIKAGETVNIFADGEDTPHPINKETIQAGTEKMMQEYPNHFGNILTGDFDVETADVWIQMIALGDIVYG